MEITAAIADITVQQPNNELEIKPMKGASFETDVQRFEHILFGEQSYQFKVTPPIDDTIVPNAISKISETLFNKVGEFKKSIDSRMDSIDQLAKSDFEMFSLADMMKVQCQIHFFSMETIFMASSSKEVGEGIKTLFHNQ